jgi:DNA polymerase-3 subunit epsilon
MAEQPVTEAPFIGRYRKRFETTYNDTTPIDAVRFVVLDCETTGLNPRADRIITIGAVAAQDGEILIEDSYEAMLKVSRNIAAVTAHGVTRNESRAGMEEREALGNVPELSARRRHCGSSHRPRPGDAQCGL